jgi:hypothetical protein
LSERRHITGREGGGEFGIIGSSHDATRHRRAKS